MSKYTLEDFINLPETIKTLRKKKNLTQIKLAKKVGVSNKAISTYESGTNTPPLDVLFKIMNTCGYTFEIKEDIYKTPKKLTLPSSSSSKTSLTLPASTSGTE